MRELSQLLSEIHDGLTVLEARGGIRLAGVDMTLPLELRPVLRDGGCVLLADVPRSGEINTWTPTPSRLCLQWGDASRDPHEGTEP